MYIAEKWDWNQKWAHLSFMAMGPDVGTIGYVISCNFRDYLFFSFFTITFISQIFNTQTLYLVFVSIKNCLNRQKWLTQIKKVTIFLHFSQILWHVKITGYTVSGKLTLAIGIPPSLVNFSYRHFQKQNRNQIAEWKSWLAKMSLSLNIQLLPSPRFWHVTLTFDFDIVIYQDMSIDNCFIPS